MKIFVSSLISGMEPIRAIVRRVVTTLRHDPIMAEDFGARPASPQVSCLSGVRESDLVILILGEHYGALQPSGLSATHEEYREAKSRKPIIAFVQSGVTRDQEQADFVNEVQAWEGGLFRGAFRGEDDFSIALTRALHDYVVANAVGPIDQHEVTERAKALLPEERSRSIGGTAVLNLAVAGSPRQSILRPIELENPTLTRDLHQEALFGNPHIFDPTAGMHPELDGGTLTLSQERRGTRVSINEQGSILVALPVREGRSGMPELIEEFVQQQIGCALAFSSWVLDRIDPTQRLAHVAIATNIANADYMGWRTQREHDTSPNSMSMGKHFSVVTALLSLSAARARRFGSTPAIL
jgi:Domain of unknown function (DUF4062)